MGPEKIVELIEHNACPDAHVVFFEVKVSDLAVVPRELDYQPFADRIPYQTRAGPTWSD